MEFSVKIEGLDKIATAGEKVRRAVADEIDKGLYASVQKVATEAKTSILDGEKSGRVYKRRTVTHKASAPGEAPASDSGDLVNKIHANPPSNGEATVVASSKHARPLELGTRTIAPRPFMLPALEKSKAWIKARLQDALRRGIERK